MAASTIAVPLQEFSRRKIRKNIFNKFLDPASENKPDNNGDRNDDSYLYQFHTASGIFN
jgi:hypothetical protein